MKNVIYGLLIFGCFSVDGMNVKETYDKRSEESGKCVKFIEVEKPTEEHIDQKRLEEGDLDRETVDENKVQGVSSFKSNDVFAAQKKLIKAFFGNTYLEERYYSLPSNNISDNDVFWFYDNTYVGDKTVVTYLIKLFPTSVFWKKMRKLVYIPYGHY